MARGFSQAILEKKIGRKSNGPISAIGLRKTSQEKMEHPKEALIGTKEKGIYICSWYSLPVLHLMKMSKWWLVWPWVKRCWLITMADYFNTWALEWSSPTTSVKTCFLLEEFAELDVVLAKVETSYTFKRKVYSGPNVYERRFGQKDYSVRP